MQTRSGVVLHDHHFLGKFMYRLLQTSQGGCEGPVEGRVEGGAVVMLLENPIEG